MEKCPCETDVQSCCACVSMHCDTCHKPMQSKFVQGRFCSNCGRPLKAELIQAYVPKSEVEKLEQDVTRLVQEKDALIKNYAECMKDCAREIFEEIRKRAYSERGFFVVNSDIDDFIAELKKKYTGDPDDIT